MWPTCSSTTTQQTHSALKVLPLHDINLKERINMPLKVRSLHLPGVQDHPRRLNPFFDHRHLCFVHVHPNRNTASVALTHAKPQLCMLLPQ
jgi:hypothetical protein